MSEFDPSQPAVLHDRLNGRMVPWTGEDCEHWKEHAQQHGKSFVNYDGFLFDGWGEALGG